MYTASKAVGRVLLIWLAAIISSARAAIARDWSSWTSWNCASSRQYSVHRCAKCATKLQSSSNQVSGRKQRLVHASEALRCRRTCVLRYNAESRSGEKWPTRFMIDLHFKTTEIVCVINLRVPSTYHNAKRPTNCYYTHIHNVPQCDNRV